MHTSLNMLVVLLVFAMLQVVCQADSVSVDWSALQKTTTNLQFGSNDQMVNIGSDSTYTYNDPGYHALLNNLNFRFLRIHAGGLPDYWSSSSTRDWDTAIIKGVYDDIYNNYPAGSPPMIMQGIANWPSWLSSPGAWLPNNLWGQYATFCANLVRIINVQQGRNVKYWELYNEIDPTGAGPTAMGQLFAQVAAAMKAVDPTIIIGGPAYEFANPGDAPIFLQAAGSNCGFISWHSYFTGDSTTYSTDQLLQDAPAMFKSAISSMQGAINVPLFMDEYNWMWDWQHAEARLNNNIGAVFFASMHKIFMDAGLTGANSWNVKDAFFGLIGTDGNDNKAWPAAYVFSWSNTYMVGTAVTSSSSNNLVETAAVRSANGGIALYVINKNSGSFTFTLNQAGPLAFTSAAQLNYVDGPNSQAVYTNIAFNPTGLHTIAGYSVWCIHQSGGGAPATPAPTSAPSPSCTIIITGTSGSIKTAYFETWTITSGGQVAVNNVADSSTLNVVAMAYVNGVVWQKNTAGNWYSKVRSSDQWTSATTTDPTASCPKPTPAPTPAPTQAPASGYIGCFIDEQNGASGIRDLPYLAIADNTVTNEECVSACTAAGYAYAGTQYSSQCFCGNSYGNQGGAAPDSDCNMACAGNSQEVCGAGWRNSVYGPKPTPTPTPTPTPAPTPSPTPKPTPKATSKPASPSGTVINIGQGRSITDASGHVWTINKAQQVVLDGNADTGTAGVIRMAYVGGVIYQMNVNMLWWHKTSPSDTWSPGSGSTTNPAPAQSLGCFQDNCASASTRQLTGPSVWESDQTVEKCLYYCGERGWPYAGVQNGAECYCGKSISSGSRIAASSCNMACNGNSAENCGGSCINNIYTSDSLGYVGCFVDFTNNARDLPYIAISYSASITIDQCRSTCAASNYLYAGLQNGQQCFCGNSYGSQGVAAATDCNSACGGDTTETCGGPGRNSVFAALPAASIPSY